MPLPERTRGAHVAIDVMRPVARMCCFYARRRPFRSAASAFLLASPFRGRDSRPIEAQEGEAVASSRDFLHHPLRNVEALSPRGLI
jgi:hypothetical protein